MEGAVADGLVASCTEAKATDSDCVFKLIECGPMDSQVDELLREMNIDSTTSRVYQLLNQEEMLVFDRSNGKAITDVPRFLTGIDALKLPYHRVENCDRVKKGSWILVAKKVNEVPITNQTNLITAERVNDRYGIRWFSKIPCESDRCRVDQYLRQRGIRQPTNVFLEMSLDHMVIIDLRDNTVVTNVNTFMRRKYDEELSVPGSASQEYPKYVFFRKVIDDPIVNRGSLIMAEDNKYIRTPPQFTKCLTCDDKIEHMFSPCCGIGTCVGCIGLMETPKCPYCTAEITGFKRLPSEYTGDRGCPDFRLYNGGPIDNIKLEDMPGLGDTYCPLLKENGYTKPSQLLYKYLETTTESERFTKFKDFMIRICNVQPKHEHHIHRFIDSLEYYLRRNLM